MAEHPQEGPYGFFRGAEPPTQPLPAPAPADAQPRPPQLPQPAPPTPAEVRAPAPSPAPPEDDSANEAEDDGAGGKVYRLPRGNKGWDGLTEQAIWVSLCAKMEPWKGPESTLEQRYQPVVDEVRARFRVAGPSN